MSDRPNPSLKATSFSVSATDSGEFVHAVTFNDGSAWTETLGPGWQCQWQPSAPAGTIDWVEHPEAMLHRKIGNLEAERDAWKKAANVARCHESKLETDLDTARKDLDFQVEQRQKLEAEVKISASEIAELQRKSGQWQELAMKAEAELAELKKTAEPLEPNRVIKTAHALILEAAQNPLTFHQKGYLFRLAKDAIEALYGGSTPKLSPYRTKGHL